MPPGQQTVIFTATRHHVEYLQVLLELADISATYIYSNLDPAARKINAAKFTSKKISVLVVTDIAARGIDIPLLDNVINYHFPAKSKLFIHRAGRVARAGRQGTVYSMVGMDEMAYFIDLQLFLGGSPEVVPLNPKPDQEWHRLIGRVPQIVNDEFSDQLTSWHQSNEDLRHTRQVAENGYKQYLKSRPGASVESVKRTKELKSLQIGDHPLLTRAVTKQDKQRSNILEEMKNFRPRSTIFEIGNTTKNKEVIEVMNIKRKKHETVIEQNAKRRRIDERIATEQTGKPFNLPTSTEEDIETVFSSVVKDSGNKRIHQERKKKKEFERNENYIPYEPSDKHTEAGYSLTKGFTAQVNILISSLKIIFYIEYNATRLCYLNCLSVCKACEAVKLLH